MSVNNNSFNNSLSFDKSKNTIIGEAKKIDNKVTKKAMENKKTGQKTGKKAINLAKLSLESIPESLAISIEQTELQIYLTPKISIAQSKLIMKRLQNIVNNLDKYNKTIDKVNQ